MPVEQSQHAIGIDVGGTKTLAAVVDVRTGTVVEVHRFDTAAETGGDAVLAQCVAIARRLRGGAGLGTAPIGLALCEIVDSAGVAVSAATIDWTGLDVDAAFGSLRSVVVESDVRAAAIAEARFGAGTGADPFVYLTVGTGIAYTLMSAGVPYRGKSGAAIVLGAPPVERVSSGTAIALRAGTPNAEAAFEDPASAVVIADAAHHLGVSMAWLAAALDPELIVIGGGLGLRDEYRSAAVSAMNAALLDFGATPVDVRPAKLGAASAAVGAALRAAAAG